jgi:ankyrin repeat protein
MMQAAMSGKKETVAELLKHDKVDANAKDRNGTTAIMMAAMRWQKKRLLLNC